MEGIISAAVAAATLFLSMKWSDEVERGRLVLIYVMVAVLMLCIFCAAGSALNRFLLYCELPSLRNLVPVTNWEFFFGVLGFYASATFSACALARYCLKLKNETDDECKKNRVDMGMLGILGPVILMLAWISLLMHNRICPGGCSWQ